MERLRGACAGRRKRFGLCSMRGLDCRFLRQFNFAPANAVPAVRPGTQSPRRRRWYVPLTCDVRARRLYLPSHPVVQAAQPGQVVLVDEEDCFTRMRVAGLVVLKRAGYGAATIGNHADFILDWPDLVGRVLLNLKP